MFYSVRSNVCRRSDFIKHDQRRQTRSKKVYRIKKKHLVNKQCLIVLGGKHFPFVEAWGRCVRKDAAGLNNSTWIM